MKELGPVSGEAFLLLKDAVDKLGDAVLLLNENQKVMMAAIGELKRNVYQLNKKEKSDG